MTILITGFAGFIGFHISRRLLKMGYTVIGIDNINSYYDINLKLRRVEELELISKKSKVKFIKFQTDIENKNKLEEIFYKFKPKKVINLAAQAGVRYSIENPSAYINSNLVGFGNILECCKKFEVEHLIFASSSSVYGGNRKLPYQEKDNTNHPISLYAATKKSNELLAHSYSHLFKIPITGLRFFTVYGPWGRPDMALYKFTKNIFENREIEIYNNGDLKRDFTYIDDITESLTRIINKIPFPKNDFNLKIPENSSSWAPYRIFNLGNSNPIKLIDYINTIEEEIGIKAKRVFMPMQPGDVFETHADTTLLESWIDYKPVMPIKLGIKNFVQWYKEFYEIK